MNAKPQMTSALRRGLSLMLALAILLALMPAGIMAVRTNAAEEETTVYLVPNENWLKDSPRFAVYYFGGSEGWVDMTEVETGVYQATVPVGTTIIFCRMNPASTENNWGNKWNQTSNLTVPTDGTNCYTVAAGTWDSGGGEWSKYPAPKVLYLKPNSNWLSDGARFAAYFFGDGNNIWVSLTDEDGDGYYECEAPEGYASLIFCRMNPASTENNWDSKWNQTSDLTVPTDDNNCYTVAEGEWDHGEGAWSVYTPDEGGEEPEPTPVTYVIAGSAELCGTAWDPSNANNAMTLNADGLYEKVYANVVAGSYEFKVTDGSWNNSWGKDSDNYTFTVEKASNVTILFDADTKTITVELEEVVATDYYLVGYINGADHGTEGDAANLGDYKFEDGKLTATFTQNSYVMVKTGDNQKWYMTNGWLGEGVTSATLYDSSTLGESANKLFVPGGKEVTFTLVENTDGSLTLSYTDGSAAPTADYYLNGYLNGADYEGTDYKFVDGKVVATFTQDSYVYVRNADYVKYMAETYCTESTVTLKTGAYEKMFVPGNQELVFTLVENTDGTLTLSYEPTEVQIPEGYTAVIIHFLKPADWGNVNGYLWNSAGAVPGYEDHNAWPGKAVTENATHSGWYDLVVLQQTPAAFYFIFNDGNAQTGDLTTGEVTGNTELWVVDNDVLTEAPNVWNGIYTYDVTLNFHNTANWETVNVKFGQGDNWNAIPGYEDYKNNEFGGAMEESSINDGWYTVTFSVIGDATAVNGLFNNGAWGGENQTGNWSTGTLNPGKNEFWYDNDTLSATAPAGWVDPDRKVYIPGTFPGPSWDAASNQMTYDGELGLYVYTFANVPAGNYEFKIAINGSWNENYGASGVAGGSNIAVTVPATMDVTVYYNDTTHCAVTNVDYVFADVTLSGTGIPENTKLTDEGLSGIYKATVSLTAGTYSDLTLTVDGVTYTFSAFELTEDRPVTFYYEPVTGLYYHNGSDVKVDGMNVFFDTKDELYKAPYGAVATGEEVTFTIQTGDDATQVKLVVKGVKTFDMTKVEQKTREAGVQKWTCTVSFDHIGEYDYYFAISNGSDVAFYGDDNYNNYYKTGDYGTGKLWTSLQELMAYDLVVYEAGFETPDWMKNAVIYQIFPDRFFDGDAANNLAQTTARGEVDYEYIPNWYTLPENPEQEGLVDAEVYKATGAWYGDGQWSNEIYGGDLQGIIQRIDYLKALGVNVIYLNPVFWSISNHRYDACDYTEIDPILGTLGDFEELVAVAEANGMHIVLDGVFNHVSDDSVYFDRYYKFLGTSEKIGAYPYWAYVYDYMAEKRVDQATAETAAKEFFGAEYGITDYSYTEWFAVSSTTMTGSVDNIGLRAGKEVYSYEGWWGYDSMPVIKSTNGSEYQTGNWGEEIIGNEDGTSVTQYWISKGNNGWRLDVANEVSGETWQHFRDSVKALDSEAVIIGEIWADATSYLMGDMYDSVMNYVFRDAVTGFARGYLINRDNKSENWDSDYTAQDAFTTLEILRERYPEEAFYAMMNLVASHDTSRVLSYLDNVQDDRDSKTLADAFPTYEGTSDKAKGLQHTVAFIQFTYAGAPTIYYGDEIGMVGADDPDDRRAMEWGKGNQELVEWYAKLAAIRAAYPALRTGSVEGFDTRSEEVMGYIRSDDAATLIVLANRSEAAVEVAVEGEYIDLVTGKAYTGAVPGYSGVILVPADQAVAVSVNTGALAPAYDPAYIVADRDVETHTHAYETKVVEPTCTEEGYTEHTCTCGNSYKTDLVPATGHDYQDGVCTHCGEKDPNAEKPTDPSDPSDPSKPTEPSKPGDNAQTGDNMNLALYVGLMVLSAAAVVGILVLRKKKTI